MRVQLSARHKSDFLFSARRRLSLILAAFFSKLSTRCLRLHRLSDVHSPVNSPSQPNHPSDLVRVAVYTADSPLVRPFDLAKQILGGMWHHRELTWTLFVRDLKAQYRQSYLGYLWVILPMIATMASWMYLNAANIVQIDSGEIPYPLFVISGALVWNVFASSVNQPSISFNEGKQVFMKLNVPVESFILSGFGHVLFNMVLQGFFLFPLFALMGLMPPATALFFPFGLLCAMIIGASIGMVLLPLGSLYTDITRLTGIVLAFGMLLTPVVYPPPESGIAHVISSWNPLTPLVVASRDWLTLGHSPYAFSLVVVTLCSVTLLIIALIGLRIAMPRLVERMGM